MARIILSDLLNDIRNSLGAHTFAIWKGLHYIRSKAATVGNPRSAEQGALRMIVEKFSRRWFTSAMDGKRDLWEAFAKQFGDASKSNERQGQKQIIPFNRKVFSGMNAYIMHNALLSGVGLATVDDAPLGKDGPPSAYNLSGVFVAGPPKKITLTWDEPAGFPGDAKVRIWGMGVKHAHKQYIATVNAAVKTYDVTAIRGARGASVGLPEDMYRFQIDAINAYGLKCAGSNIAEVNYA